MTHEEIEQLLGAYALDAVSPEEKAEIDEHLLECPRCQQEVVGHLQVAGVLGSLGGSAPAGLWDRIAGELALGSGSASDGAAPPMPVMPTAGIPSEEEESPPVIAPVIAIHHGHSRPRKEEAARRRGRRGDQRVRRPLNGATLALTSVAAALLVVVGLLAATIVGLNHRVSHLQSAIVVGGVSGQVQAALQDPSHQTVQLTSAVTGEPWRASVVLDHGEAFLVPGKMPAIAADKTFQAWAKVGGSYVSLGVLGSHPGDTEVQLQHGMRSVLLNVEPEGGTTSPTSPPLVAAALPRTV